MINPGPENRSRVRLKLKKYIEQCSERNKQIGAYQWSETRWPRARATTTNIAVLMMRDIRLEKVQLRSSWMSPISDV